MQKKEVLRSISQHIFPSYGFGPSRGIKTVADAGCVEFEFCLELFCKGRVVSVRCLFHECCTVFCCKSSGVGAHKVSVVSGVIKIDVGLSVRLGKNKALGLESQPCFFAEQGIGAEGGVPGQSAVGNVGEFVEDGIFGDRGGLKNNQIVVGSLVGKGRIAS